jgi:hypothetical protein
VPRRLPVPVADRGQPAISGGQGSLDGDERRGQRTVAGHEERLMRRVDAVGLPAPPTAPRMPASGGLPCDGVTVALGAWRQGGGFLDGWAHHHGRVDAAFFTPWYAVRYTGWLAVAGWVVGALVHHRAPGEAWGRALPPGYGLSVVGVLVCAAGGLGDARWHQRFGVEQRLEALYSQSHVTLAGWLLSYVILLAPPPRAANLRVRLDLRG